MSTTKTDRLKEIIREEFKNEEVKENNLKILKKMLQESIQNMNDENENDSTD